MIINWSVTDLITKENTVVFSNRITRQWIEIEDRVFQWLMENYHYTRDVLIEKICIEQNESAKTAIEFVEKMIDYGFFSNATREEKRIVSLYITDKCNLFCKYCYRSATADNNGFLDVTYIRDIFGKLSIKFDCKTLVISGGEPLLHPDLHYILRLAGEYFSTIILQTNGTLIDEENIRWIKEKVNKIRVGLDGSNAEINDKIRGKGSFYKIMRGIEIIRKNDVPLTISTTLYDSNIKDVDNIALLAESMGAELIFTDFMPLGRGVNHKEEIMHNQKKNANKSTDIKCSAFCKKFSVDHEGNVYPCDELMNRDFLIGSIFKLDENNIYENELIKKLVSRNIYTVEKCKRCQFRYNCNALCPAQTYREYGTISLTEANCEQIHT